MSKTFVLKENNEVIRQAILRAGIKVCICARFNNACWLDYNVGITDSVHGIGYATEDSEDQATVLDFFVSENPNAVYCSDVDEFIAKIKEAES